MDDKPTVGKIEQLTVTTPTAETLNKISGQIKDIGDSNPEAVRALKDVITFLQSQLDTARGEVERYNALLTRILNAAIANYPKDGSYHKGYIDYVIHTLDQSNKIRKQTDKEVSGDAP